MELKLTKEENIKLIYNVCPRCHQTFNAKSRKKTMHHAIPSFLKPKTTVEVNLCESCHEELNGFYRGQEVADRKYQFKSGSFAEFEQTYLKLRRNFHDKKINRGAIRRGLMV